MVRAENNGNLEHFDITLYPLFEGAQVAAIETTAQMDRFSATVHHRLSPPDRISSTASAARRIADELYILVVYGKRFRLILNR